MSEEVIETLWQRRVAWSRAADSLKRRISFAGNTALLLSITGAILETLAGTLLRTDPAHYYSAGAGAVLLAVATFLTAKFVTTGSLRQWSRMRSVSEAMKHEIFAFRTQTKPFLLPQGVAHLQTRVQEIEEAAADLEPLVAGTDTSEASPPPPFLTPDQYLEQRIQQQIQQYYRRKAVIYKKRLAFFRGFEVALGIAATALATIGTFTTSASQRTGQSGPHTGIVSWVAVLTTVSGALAAHVAASRYDFAVVTYYATARRLEDLVNQWRSRGAATDVDSWTCLVLSCEDAISSENKSWMAKWSE
jgi:hypothetical protein